MKNLYDYNDSDNELDAGFLILAFLIGLLDREILDSSEIDMIMKGEALPAFEKPAVVSEAAKSGEKAKEKKVKEKSLLKSEYTSIRKMLSIMKHI